VVEDDIEEAKMAEAAAQDNICAAQDEIGVTEDKSE
jgi:hypothetical protein